MSTDSPPSASSSSGTPHPSGVGRERAVKETANFPKGTCGHVVHSAVSKAHAYTGDVASGTIGEHYAEPAMQKMFALPDTTPNLTNIANHETEKHWAKQPGAAGVVGRSMGKETRLGLLVAERDGSLYVGAKARCDALKNSATSKSSATSKKGDE